MFREKRFIDSLIMAFIVFSVVFSTSIELFAFDYVIDNFNFYATPWGMPKPAKGVPFKDSVFHTEIVRITDITDNIEGSTLSLVSGYPKHDIENADGTKLILQGDGGSTWHIWNANPPYKRIKHIPATLIGWGSQIDARWDTVDPNIIYYTYNSRLTKYNVVTDEAIVLHDFRTDNLVPAGSGLKFAEVHMYEEGTPSTEPPNNSRYWGYRVSALPGWSHYATIVFDKDYYGPNNGKVISYIDKNSPTFHVADYVSMSPSGKYLWIGSHVYPRDLSTVKLTHLVGHADVGYSKEGREIAVGVNDAAENPYLAMTDLETGVQTKLHLWDKNQFHVSANCTLTPGWALFSTYTPMLGNEKGWGDLQLYMVETTTRTDPPPRIWRVAHNHVWLKDYGDYAGCSFAKINRKGTKMWFGSYWKTPNKDVYQVNLPSSWYQDLMGSMGNLPPTASISATPLSGKPPLTVNFTGSGKDIDGTIVSYTWNFGDGSTSNQQKASHTYETPGSFIATLKVIDDKGAIGSTNVTINILKSDTTPPAPPSGLKIVK